MKRLLSLVAFFATLQASAQQVNPVPDYVFRNQMSVGRGTVTDTAAYFSIGPRYGANKGFMPPIVGDTATFSSGKRNGLLIFSVQKNKFLYWDSVRVQWSDMAGSSGSYITGSGITGYLPQFSASTTLDTSALFTIGNRLGIGSSTFAYTSTNTANVELNGTAGGILGFKRNDSARGYLWHTGDNMELANTVAGSISFNTNSATRGSISSAGVWRLHNLAGTGDRVVQASSNGTLSASTSVTGLVDTTTISTRAWRQKGDDSLGAIIATKGSGTVTSVATGYGLSGGTITTTGTLLVDTLNIATRAWRQKGLDSLAALEVSGSGTTNYIPKFTAGSTIGNSQIFDNGTNVGVGTASPSEKLHAVGNILASDNAGSYPRFISTVGAKSWEIGYRSGTLNYEVREDGTTRLAISNGGEVLINTTTDAGDYRLQVNGAGIFGSGTTDNQVLLAFPQDLKLRYRQSISSAYGFLLDSANVESLFLTSFESSNTQALLLMGDGFSKNIFGFSHSTDYGVTYTADFVIEATGIIGIGTNAPNTSAQLDISSTTRGFLPPRMTTTQRDAISSPAAGLVIYNTTTSKLQVYTTSWTDLH